MKFRRRLRRVLCSLVLAGALVGAGCSELSGLTSKDAGVGPPDASVPPAGTLDASASEDMKADEAKPTEEAKPEEKK